MLPLVIVGGGLGVAWLYEKAKKAKATSTQKSLAPASTDKLAKTAEGAIDVAATAALALAGADVGHAVAMKTFGVEPGSTVDVVTTAGGAVAGATVALLALGVLPVAGWIIIGVVVVVVFAVFIIDDLERLGRGQKGAEDDYNTMWQKTYDSAWLKARAHPDYSKLGDDDIRRFLIPMVDGVCLELNRLKMMAWFLVGWKPHQFDYTKNALNPTRLYLAHAQEGAETARYLGAVHYVSGTAENRDNIALDVPDRVIRSKQQAFIDKYYPVAAATTVTPAPPPNKTVMGIVG